MGGGGSPPCPLEELIIGILLILIVRHRVIFEPVVHPQHHAAVPTAKKEGEDIDEKPWTLKFILQIVGETRSFI